MNNLSKYYSKEDKQMANMYIKMLNITNQERNKKQNQNERSPHSI
jgi:hypothetical protein